MTAVLPGLVLSLAAGSATASEIGGPVPEFSVTTLESGRFTLSEAVQAHPAVVVLFTSTVCPYANYFGEYVRELSLRYADRGVLVIGLNSNQFETAQETLENARRRGHAFPMAMDEGGRVAELLGARRTPEAFVVDSAGRLRYRGWVKSKLGSPDLADALDAVLDGRPVRKASTPAFGCAIDRSKHSHK